MLEDMTTYEDKVDDLLTDLEISQEVVNAYDMDYLLLTVTQASESIYYSIITLYNTNVLGTTNPFGLKDLSVKKDKDTYTLTFKSDNVKTEIIMQSTNTSSSVVTKVDDKFQSRFEKIILGDGGYAIQNVILDETTYIVSEFYFKGTIGRMMIDEEVTTLPASIYNKPSMINTEFATGGDRSYEIKTNDFIYHIRDINEDPEYTVNFEENGGSVVSSFTGTIIQSQPSTTKSGYTFIGWYSNSDLTGNAINFPYTLTSDHTLYAKWQLIASNNITVTFNSMGGSVVAPISVTKGTTVNIPNDPTKNGLVFAGWYEDIDYVTKYDFSQAVTFDITLFAKWEEVIPEIITMTEAYYNNLNDIDYGFFFPNMMNPSLMTDLILNETIYVFFDGVAMESFSKEWSAPYILNETVFALLSYLDGTFSTLFPAQSVNNITLTPEVVVNSSTNTYTVKLWLTKKMGIVNYDFWFINTLSYDEATDSLKATIQCGVGEEQRTRNIIEYKKTSDGTFYSWILSPDDLDEIGGKQNCIKSVTNKTNGKILYDRLLDSTYRPASLYKAINIQSSEYVNGDKVLEIKDNKVTFTNKLVSALDMYLKAYMESESTLLTAINDAYDETNSAYDYFDAGYFTYEWFSYEIETPIYMIKNYEEKVTEDFSDYEYDYTLTFANNEYVVNAKSKESSDYSYKVKVKLVDNKVSILYEDTEKTVRAEIIQVTGGYAMQLYNKMVDYNNLTQLVIENGKSYMSYSEDVDSDPVSIITNYNSVTFAKMGNLYNFSFIAGTLKAIE